MSTDEAAKRREHARSRGLRLAAKVATVGGFAVAALGLAEARAASASPAPTHAAAAHDDTAPLPLEGFEVTGGNCGCVPCWGPPAPPEKRRGRARARKRTSRTRGAAMSTLDLRRAARRSPLAPIDLSGLSAADLAAARINWRERMVSEHASARVFGELVGDMMSAGLPADETYRVAEMVRQELDHARLCASVLVAIGETPVADLPELVHVPRHDDARTPLEAVLRNVISIGCCSETVAVALVATERELAGPRAIRRVLDQILRDEIKHSRFGWRLVSRLAPALSARERASLDEYLVDAFAHQVRFHAPFLDMPCAGDAGLAVGAPHGRSNWLVFTSTMNDIVIPGLERCGLSARDAWRDVVEVDRAA